MLYCKDWSHRIRGCNFAVEKSKCIPSLLYGVDACALTKSELSFLDFIVNRFFMKLFKTNNIDVVKSCQLYFGISLPSEEWVKRAKN